MASASLSDQDVLLELRRLVRLGLVAWTAHAEERLIQRGVSKGQVKSVLLSGKFFERPHVPLRSGAIEYKFTMRGSSDGQKLDVPASLLPGDRVVIITVTELGT